MNVLGIIAFNHDAAAALVQDGVPGAASAEERFSGKRHDPAFPKRAVRFCLRQSGLSVEDLDCVVVAEKPLRKFERVLVTQLRGFPRSARSFSRSMFAWLGDRVWMRSRVASELGVDPSRVFFVEHHLAHAAATYRASPFEEAAILVVDGAGEWATTSLHHGKGDIIEPLSEIHFPHSLGLLYSGVTSFLGYEPDDGEHRVMELGAGGEPCFASELSELIHLEDDGSFRLDEARMRPFDARHPFGQELEALLGPPRRPDSGPPDSRHRDIAHSLQHVLEEALLHLVRELHRRTGSARLCLGGGVALNVVANARILRDGPFKRLFVPPAPHAQGTALGAALEASHLMSGRPLPRVPLDAFLGEEVREEAEGDPRLLPDEDALLDEAISRLRGGGPIGWIQGRFEWGPRSLGHRSLLADPRSEAAVQRLGSIRRNEAFQPFSCSVTEEKARELFVVPEGGDAPCGHKLLAVSCQPVILELAPSVRHRDGTARLQIVRKESQPLFHRLLTRFGEEAGAPLLLSPSLSRSGETMARGEAEGRRFLERSELEALFVRRRLFERR